MTPANPLATPPTATPTVTPCETCHAPLAAEAVRRRATVERDGKRCCGECSVPPPRDIAAALHYCRRCGRELNATTFANGQAIRVGDASICLPCVERDREVGRRQGLYHCDNCNREIPIPEIAAGRAAVIDKALLCRKCRSRVPDPAGRREAGQGEPHPVGMRPRTPAQGATGAAPTPSTPAAPAASVSTPLPAAGLGSSQALPTFETAPHSAVTSDRLERRTGPQAAVTTEPATKSEQPSQTLSADLDLKAHTPATAAGVANSAALTTAPEEPATPEIVEDAPPPLHEVGQTRPQDATVPDLDAATVRNLLGEKRAAAPRNGRGGPAPRPALMTAAPLPAGAPTGAADIEAVPPAADDDGEPASEDGVTPRPFREAVARRSPSGRLAAARRSRGLASDDVDHGPFPEERAPAESSRTVIGVMGGLVLILCVLVLYLVLTRANETGGTAAAPNSTAGSEPTLQLLLEGMRDEQKRIGNQLDEQDDRIAVLESQIRALAKHIEGLGTGGATDNQTGNTNSVDAGNQPDPPTDTLKLLRERLDSPNPAVRLDAVIDAYQRYERSVADRLLEIIESDSDRYVRVFAIETLAHFQERAALDTLRQLAGLSEDPLIKDAAALAVAALEGRPGSPPGN